MKTQKRLETVSHELQRIAEHIAQYSGIDAKEADIMDNIATGIAEMAAGIAAEARTKAGNRSGKTLVRNVRKALGYTVP